ncbi:hypothetical protein CRE_06904 [Caenorhabditis remanei]|uniref:Uncharacterized protein n=1 Tax=Caenorhabditis remanei TaxID=31234 RepID=E3MZJ6_CAERE|nr:hypothetical protein CRE_06904 [Caenorhabditis remanei]
MIFCFILIFLLPHQLLTVEWSNGTLSRWKRVQKSRVTIVDPSLVTQCTSSRCGNLYRNHSNNLETGVVKSTRRVDNFISCHKKEKNHKKIHKPND